MKNLAFFIFILACAFLQVTFLDFFRAFGVKPDLILMAMVIVNLTLDRKWAFGLSVFSGMLKDLLALHTFGVNTLSFALWSYLLIKLSRKVSLESMYLRMALLFVVLVSNDIITRAALPFGIFLRITFLEAVYTACLLPLAFKAVRPLAPS